MIAGWYHEPADPSVGIFGDGWFHEEGHADDEMVAEAHATGLPPRVEGGTVYYEDEVVCDCGARIVVVRESWPITLMKDET